VVLGAGFVACAGPLFAMIYFHYRYCFFEPHYQPSMMKHAKQTTEYWEISMPLCACHCIDHLRENAHADLIATPAKKLR